MEQRELLEQLFQEAFQPEDYVNTFYKSLDPEVEFFLTNLHHYFDSRGTKRFLINVSYCQRLGVVVFVFLREWLYLIELQR